MRANPTPSEKVLWDELRAKKLGVRFRRQAIIMGWIVDFYCPSQRLVLELDGKVHGEIENQSRDIERDKVMKTRGLRVLRIRSYRVFHELPKVLFEIRQMIVT